MKESKQATPEEIISDVANGETKLIKKEKDIKYSANFDGLCDIVLDGKEVKYLLENGEIAERVVIEDKVFQPPSTLDLDYMLPQVSEIIKESKTHDTVRYDKQSSDMLLSDTSDSVRGCASCQSLYKELYNYHKSISELPEDIYLDLLVLFDFHTYLIERFSFSPILYLFADKERGKTRTAKGLIYIARRGIMTETLREANLIRWSKDHRATLLFDVKNFPRKLETTQSEDLIYGRAEKGVIASRVLFPEKGAFRDTVRFEVFGPTIVTSNKMIDDVGMSRTILLEMKPSEKVFMFEPTPENALPLKTKLYGMRLAHFNDSFAQVEKEETGRIEDMLMGYKSLILTLFPDTLKTYYKLKKIIKGQKIENALDSFEAQLLQIIIENGIAVEEGTLCMTFDFICSVYNEGKPEKWHLSPQSLSKSLKGMGFTSKKNSTGNKRGIFYDTTLINKLKKIYGLEDLEGHPRQVSDSADTANTQAQTEEKSGLTDEEIRSLFNT